MWIIWSRFCSVFFNLTNDFNLFCMLTTICLKPTLFFCFKKFHHYRFPSVVNLKNKTEILKTSIISVSLYESTIFQWIILQLTWFCFGLRYLVFWHPVHKIFSRQPRGPRNFLFTYVKDRLDNATSYIVLKTVKTQLKQPILTP